MSLGYVLIPFAIGFVVVLGATPAVIRFAGRYSLFDPTDGRKTHAHGIPRLGGAALAAGVVGAGLLAMLWGEHHFSGRFAWSLVAGFAPILAVSLWDDLRSLPWWPRFLAQLAGASVFALLLHPLERLNLPFVGTIDLGAWSFSVTVGWLVLTTNAMNFIDGLDGLAAGTAAIAGLALMSSAFRVGAVAPTAVAAAVVGSCAGFLPYNFPPARVFMGDSGATLLGFALGAVALVGAGKNVALVSMLLPILALGLPLSDTIGAIVRRSRRGSSIFEADREHVHHSLLALGLGYRRTVVLLYLASAFLGAVGLLLATGPREAVLFFAVLGLACVLLLLRRRPRAGGS